MKRWIMPAVIARATTVLVQPGESLSPWTVDHCMALGPALPAFVCLEGEHE